MVKKKMKPGHDKADQSETQERKTKAKNHWEEMVAARVEAAKEKPKEKAADVASVSFSTKASVVEGPRTYTVQSGDSLSKIAKALLGDANRWPEIFEANKDKIKDPNMIHVGQELVIPDA